MSTVGESPRTLYVGGPRGVGKSAVAWAVFSALIGRGVHTGYVDLAQLGFHRPAAPDLVDRNLATLTRTYRAAGASHLVLCGDPRHLPPGASLCWLHAGRATLVERLLLRGLGHGPPIPGDDLRGRPPAELRALASVTGPPARADLVLDTEGREVPELAAAVLAALDGWPDPD